MKNVLSLLLVLCSVILTSFFSPMATYAECEIDHEGTQAISEMIHGCIESDSTLVIQKKDLTIGDNTNKIINSLIKLLGALLGAVAVLMISYGGLLMVMSGGEDEKIKKGKDLIKWTLLGFISLVIAGGIVSLVISTIYQLSRAT